jgi:hypothetical protein
MTPKPTARPVFAPPVPLESLLQAILAPLPLAALGFESWRRNTQFDALPEAHFRLLGELALVIDRLDPNWREKPRVFGIQKYCWSNNIHIIRTALPVIDNLIAAGIRFVLLKGGGIIAHEPNAMHWRMIRDIDLLVSTADILPATEILLATGWRPMTGRLPGALRAQAFDRRGPTNPYAPNRIEIDLHHRVLHPGRYGDFDADFIARSQIGTLLGREVLSPHVVDQALTAVSQALMYSDHPNYVWIGDAVRAMQTPAFDWPEFWARVMQRDILLHAQSVVGYLKETFALPVSNMPEPAALSGRLRGFLHAAEISAMGRSRVRRGLSGRLAMLTAEYLRSRAIRRPTTFRTDYTVDMRPHNALDTPLKRAGDGFTWDVVQRRGGGISILVRFATPITGRLELDLWAGERWVRRLKVKPRMDMRFAKCLWKATLNNVEPGIIYVMRLELSPSAHAESH